MQVQRVAFEKAAPRANSSAWCTPATRPILVSASAARSSSAVVNVGDRVREGDVIARLDPKDLRLQVESAEVELAAATSNLSQAAADYERYTTLKERGYAAIAEFDRKKAANDEAEGRLGRARRALDLARNQLDYAELKADADGVITATRVEPGQVVAIGQAVAQLAHRRREGSCRRAAGNLARRGAPSQGEVKLWSDDGRSFQAKLRELSPQADAATRTYAARFTILDADDSVAFGMTATVTLGRSAEGKVAKLPLSSVLNRGNGPSVYVVDETGALSAAAGDGRRLHGGLRAGQRRREQWRQDRHPRRAEARSRMESPRRRSRAIDHRPTARSAAMKHFNLSEWAITHRALVLFMILLIGAAGLFSYYKLGRAEDPSFTIKVMNIQVGWPGATASELQTQVVDKIEKKLQELPYLDRVDELHAARHRFHPGQSVRHHAAQKGEGALVPGRARRSATSAPICRRGSPVRISTTSSATSIPRST